MVVPVQLDSSFVAAVRAIWYRAEDAPVIKRIRNMAIESV